MYTNIDHFVTHSLQGQGQQSGEDSSSGSRLSDSLWPLNCAAPESESSERILSFLSLMDSELVTVLARVEASLKHSVIGKWHALTSAINTSSSWSNRNNNQLGYVTCFENKVVPCCSNLFWKMIPWTLIKNRWAFSKRYCRTEDVNVNISIGTFKWVG